MRNDFVFFSEQFGDIRILRYLVPGFETLPLQQKKFIYYLSKAANEGRDILMDQNCKYNLLIRTVLEMIYTDNAGHEHTSDWDAFVVYLKRIWFSNGIHHHYSTDKITPEFSKDAFHKWLAPLSLNGISHQMGMSNDEMISLLDRVLFDKSFLAKRVEQNPDQDLIKLSANNFYEDVSQQEVETYYTSLKKADGDEPVSWGLNSKLIKNENGDLEEKVWKIRGMYHNAIHKIIYWLEKAKHEALTVQQRRVLSVLIDFYETGDLKKFDEYSIEWLKELESPVDFINGFIEIYGDSLGYKATWEALVNFTDAEETNNVRLVAENAQWFEDHSPVDFAFKKEKVSGVSMKVINAVMLGGDCHPATPLGINLPNADWIREKFGSKSVTLSNIAHAYHEANLSTGFIEEFAFSNEEIQLHKKYGALADDLHTHLHECVGHGSGKLLTGVSTDSLKAYGSVIEEARADLFGLYYVMDEKLIELGLMPSLDVARAQYNSYVRNGLMTQLTRISAGKNIEQAHMRNRQLVSKWVFEKGGDEVIVKVVRSGKSYFVVKNHLKLRVLFGDLLAEVQRIKSEGDYDAAKLLVEMYGVKVDQEIHSEVIERYQTLGLAPYSGFINPELELIYNADDEICDVKISYPNDFAVQMIKYSQENGHLGIVN